MLCTLLAACTQPVHTANSMIEKFDESCHWCIAHQVACEWLHQIHTKSMLENKLPNNTVGYWHYYFALNISDHHAFLDANLDFAIFFQYCICLSVNSNTGARYLRSIPVRASLAADTLLILQSSFGILFFLGISICRNFSLSGF